MQQQRSNTVSQPKTTREVEPRIDPTAIPISMAASTPTTSTTIIVVITVRNSYSSYLIIQGEKWAPRIRPVEQKLVKAERKDIASFLGPCRAFHCLQHGNAVRAWRVLADK